MHSAPERAAGDCARAAEQGWSRAELGHCLLWLALSTTETDQEDEGLEALDAAEALADAIDPAVAPLLSWARAVLQRDSAVRESVIENSQILELPLDGRNILDLAYLSPGAAKNLTNAGLGDFASNGNRPNGNTYLIDGVSARDEIRGQNHIGNSLIRPGERLLASP